MSRHKLTKAVLLPVCVFATLFLSCVMVSALTAQEKKPKMVRVPTAGNKAKKVDESREPSLTFQLNVGGKVFQGKVGKSFQLKGDFKDANATIKVFPSRKFQYAGLSFEYPQKMTWETELKDSSSKSWTMMGVGCSINVFDIDDADYTASEYAKVLIDDFDTDEFDEEDFSITLGGKKYTGIRLIFEVDKEEYIYDIIKLPNRGARSRLMLLEEVAPDRNPDNAEAKQVLAMLKKSMKVEK